MIKRLFISLILTPLVASSLAQEQNTLEMNLQECIEYAKNNSINIQQAMVDLQNYQIDESSAKAAFLPSLSGSTSQGIVNTPFDSISGDPKTSYSGSYSLDMAMEIYSGGENKFTLKRSKLLSQIAALAVDEEQSALEIAITQIYVEILYAMEQIAVTEQSLTLSQRNIERGEALKEVGSLNEADFAQLLTAEATERYNLVVAQTDLSNKYLQLKHLLEITDGTTLNIKPEGLIDGTLALNIPSIGEVYNEAMTSRPEILASSKAIESASINERIAKSGYMPSLSLSAGIGMGHTSTSDYTFKSQLKSGYNHSVGLNLSVPIFSKFSNRNAVAKSRNETRYAELSLAQESKTLYQTIEALHTSATNAYAMYEVSKSKLEALERSLRLVTEQYELGMKDIIDLLTEQNDMRLSSQSYLESKYVLILNKALLEYYKTGDIKL